MLLRRNSELPVKNRVSETDERDKIAQAIRGEGKKKFIFSANEDFPLIFAQTRNHSRDIQAVRPLARTSPIPNGHGGPKRETA